MIIIVIIITTRETINVHRPLPEGATAGVL